MITGVKYLERPASPDEKAIASVIEAFLEGHKQDNQALRQFLTDAVVVEVAGGKRKLRKNEFLEYFESNGPTIRQLYYWDVLIRLKSSTEAIVSYTCHRQHKRSTKFYINKRIFLFAKNLLDRQWYISSSICVN